MDATRINLNVAEVVAPRALAATFRLAVAAPTAWDRAVEIERARQRWSLSGPPKEV
jgi:hypothetical protein